MTLLITLFTIICLTIVLYKPIKAYLKNVDWKLVFNNFDITRILGRNYYFNNLLIILIIDFIYLTVNEFSFEFTVMLLILGIITFFIVINYLRYFTLKAFSNSYKNKLPQQTERSSVSSGVPRCGKTSSKNFTAVQLAKKQWKDLQRDYWFCLNFKLEELPEKLRNHKNEIIKAYNYAISNIKTHIPCLFSFQPIFVGKRQSYDLSKKMLLQKIAIPYRAVLMVDEIGVVFPNKKRKIEEDSNIDLDKLSDLCRFIGHYLDGYLLLTEQEFSKAFIDIRRVTGENIYFTKKQEWILKPYFLLFIYELIFSFFDWYLFELTFLKKQTSQYYNSLNSLYSSSHRWFKLMKWLKKLIYCVGFRKYKYENLSNKEVEVSATKNEKGTFYLPACLNCSYNERVYRNMYEPKDQPFKKPKLQNFFPSKEELLDRFSD